MSALRPVRLALTDSVLEPEPALAAVVVDP
jgi:hypothetical protein